jgi:hypothetical protein
VDTRGEDRAARAGHDLLGGGDVQDQQRGGIVQVPRIKLKCGGLREEAWKDGRRLPT